MTLRARYFVASSTSASARPMRRARCCSEVVEASFGYICRPFRLMYDLDIRKTVGPPVGAVYGYPPRGDEDVHRWRQRASRLARKSTTRRSTP